MSLYPLGAPDYHSPIGRALELIAASGLSHEVGGMATVLRGSSGEVFGLLRGIGDALNAEGCKFSMSVTVSNTCGLE